MQQTDIGVEIGSLDQRIQEAEHRAQQTRQAATAKERESDTLNERIAETRRQLEAIEVQAEVDQTALGQNHGAIASQVRALVDEEATIYRQGMIKRKAAHEHQRQARELSTELSEIVRIGLPAAYTAKAEGTKAALRKALADHALTTSKAAGLPVSAIDLTRLTQNAVNGGLAVEFSDQAKLWKDRMGR